MMWKVKTLFFPVLLRALTWMFFVCGWAFPSFEDVLLQYPFHNCKWVTLINGDACGVVGGAFKDLKAWNVSDKFSIQNLSLHIFHLMCLWTYRSTHAGRYRCIPKYVPDSGVVPLKCVLHRLPDTPFMEEIAEDFKVAGSGLEPLKVFMPADSGLPDKLLKTFNPVNSQCKSVCCSVHIHNYQFNPC